MTVTDYREDAVICQECGHDCSLVECEDYCVCEDEYPYEIDYYAYAYAEQDYWED